MLNRINPFSNSKSQVAFLVGLCLGVLVLLPKLRRQTQRLEELVDLDPLTGVANRRSFFNAAEMEIRRSQRYNLIFSFAYIDIDNFRLVNHIYGQKAGDEVLQLIASAIHEKTRNIDTVGRLGGDEFGILLPQTDGENAKLASRRIQDLLTELVMTGRLPITFSMAVVTFAQPPASIWEMAERADKLMSSMKKAGKNSIAFES